MPFAIFRRHEKKLMAVFAIMAMFAFVLSDSLFGLLRGGRDAGAKADTVIAELYGKPVRRSDLEELDRDRRLANAFMENLFRQERSMFPFKVFGETDTRSLVDGLILQHKADELGLPNDPALAREWLSQVTGGQMDTTLFEIVLSPFYKNQNITGEQMLQALASQIRLNRVRQLPGMPEITPLDLLQAYRDRYERVSVDAVRVPVADFLSQVPDPSESELLAYYNRYKEVLPEPNRDTPGFKVPRLVQVEFASIDGEAIARQIQPKLTEQELLDYYENQKSDRSRALEFTLPPLPNLPESLFEDDPQNKNTPPPADAKNLSDEVKPEAGPRYRPFSELRNVMEAELSREKAREVVDQKFNAVRDAMLEFGNTYSAVQEDNKDAQERGDKNLKPLPSRPNLKPLADKEGLTLEVSPMLTREAAEHYGAISAAHVGASRLSEGRTFVDEMFTPSAVLFEPIELTTEQGQYFLAWKIADNPPRVPPLQEIRAEVVRAWKTEKARPLAEKAAREIADRARQAGGKLTADTAGKRLVLTTEPASKLAISLPAAGMFTPPRARPTDIPQIPDPSEELRDALFSLEQGEVAVEPDQPKSAYYVLTLHQRFPVDYRTLYAPNGPRARLQLEVANEARERQQEAWLGQLRSEAGLKPDWRPPDEDETRTRRPRES